MNPTPDTMSAAHLRTYHIAKTKDHERGGDMLYLASNNLTGPFAFYRLPPGAVQGQRIALLSDLSKTLAEAGIPKRLITAGSKAAQRIKQEQREIAGNPLFR